MCTIKIYFPGQKYSDNKEAIKSIFRRYSCIWDRKDNGWFNQKENYLVYAEFEGSKKPATFFAKGPKTFILEFRENCLHNGGEVLQEMQEEGGKEENLPWEVREETINRLLQNMKEELEEKRFSGFDQEQKQRLLNTAEKYWSRKREEALANAN